jgi:putative membrane protein
MHWQQEGSDPDYRFTLANERTYLAWIRTALAILAGAVVLHQLFAKEGSGWQLTACSTALAALAGGLGAGAYRHWKENEIAMRHSRSLPRSFLIPSLAVAVVVTSVAAAAFVWAVR